MRHGTLVAVASGSLFSSPQERLLPEEFKSTASYIALAGQDLAELKVSVLDTFINVALASRCSMKGPTLHLGCEV
jgi:hypothetical protein